MAVIEDIGDAATQMFNCGSQRIGMNRYVFVDFLDLKTTPVFEIGEGNQSKCDCSEKRRIECGFETVFFEHEDNYWRQGENPEQFQ